LADYIKDRTALALILFITSYHITSLTEC